MSSDIQTNLSLFPNLISDSTVLTKQARLFRKKRIEKSIAPYDSDAYITKGWEVIRPGKRSSRVARNKRHDEDLEQRIWLLLFNMGYNQLNTIGFKVPFTRDDGSTGKKQIDVFALDNETIFIIECKSKEKRGRRTLQKDLHETAFLQPLIHKEIIAKFPKGERPKLIWAYATRNIIWSEADIIRAQSSKIHIISENEIQYFETFIKHMGSAGKYQILAEFLKGQKVEKLQGKVLPAVKGKIGGEEFYSFVTSPRDLMKIAFINHQSLSTPGGDPAYQRMIESSRIKKIRKFISDGGYFPTNLLINFTQVIKFDPIDNKLNTDPNIKFGWITLPSTYKSAWIIDGQHRLFGFSELEDKQLDQPLFVVAFEKMVKIKEAELFITINHEQKSVPKSLLVSLLADLKLGSDDPKIAITALASAVVRSLNADKTSPFYRRFALPGIPQEEGQNLTISEVVNGLNRSNLIGRIVSKKLIAGIFSDKDDRSTIIRSCKIINGYFEAIMNANSQRWEDGKTAHISVNWGIRAHLQLISEVVKYIEYHNTLDFMAMPPDEVIKRIVSFCEPVFEFIQKAGDSEIAENFARKFGEGGVKEYIFNIYNIVSKQTPDFGSDDFKQFISQKSDSRVAEADNTVINLTRDIHDYVVTILKEIHGIRELQSGEVAFWALGVESRRAKDNAFKKQQADEPDKRLKLEGYLDILDLRDIVKQQNNWMHFESVFNIPMLNEKKGKKFYLQWLADFNELRRIPAHKNALRTYSEEDFEYLDWLRSEFYSRFPKKDDSID